MKLNELYVDVCFTVYTCAMIYTPSAFETIFDFLTLTNLFLFLSKIVIIIIIICISKLAFWQIWLLSMFKT